jgi:GMP synthase (glutamine-hydrolysing)
VRALAIVNSRDAGPGVFAETMTSRGVELETWVPAEAPAPPGLSPFAALLAFGGPMHADQEDANPWLGTEKRALAEALDRELPILAVCLGAQLLAEAAGAIARRAAEPQIGWRQVDVTAAGTADPLIGPLAPSFEAFQWHSYEVPPPPGAVELAHDPVCLQAYRIRERAWGIQFHAEVTRGDVEGWIRDCHSDPDAVRIGIDPDELRGDTLPRIADWNRLGAGLCERFLDAATRA